MRRIFAPTLIIFLGISATFGCHSRRLPEVGGDFLVSKAGLDSNESFQSPLPAPEGFVSDSANVLDEETEGRLEKTLAEFKRRAKVDLALVTVGTTGSQSTFDYSLAVARGWGVGAGNPDKAGVLILIAVDDRKWHVQISRALEKVLSNDEVAQMGSAMNVPFKEKRYGEGVSKCVDAFIKTLSERRALS